MNFAKNILGKYGWKEGDGLGRNNDGIIKPLKANYKFDNSGLGHNKADEMNNHWWEHAYNKASTNINISNNSKKSVEITTTNSCSPNNINKMKNVEKNSNYGGSFLKSATLTNEGREVEDPNKQVVSPLILKIVSDDELFKACGGRTAHKGARHGLKLSGKLTRIEEQERELIQKMESTADSSKVFKDYVDCQSRLNAKKLKRLKKTRKNKLRKSTKIVTHELTSSLQATRTNQVQHQEGQKMMKEENEQTEKHPKVKLHKLVKAKVEKKRKEKKVKLKKLTNKMHVSDTKDNSLKKMQ